MRVQIYRSSIELVQGDITEQDVEAIVNAANDRFWMSAGVAGAIKSKGGEEIEQEAMNLGPIPVGQAIVTGAGKLKAKYVIHAAVMGQDLKTDADKVSQATANSLQRAQEQQFNSIALPAFGTGVGGLALEVSAKAMLDTAIDFLQSAEHPVAVRFVLFDKDTYDAFRQQLRAFFSRPPAD